MLKTASKMEFRPVTYSTYKHTSVKASYSIAIKINLHLLTVASYDPVILEMLQNLTGGNFNTQELVPQRENGKS